MQATEKRHTLEQLLREEKEFLKLQMYLRDDRFHELEKDPSLRGQLHKTILDMLHCPMRTNEKVLTLLYELVLQGAHKAQASTIFDELTPIIRRLGSLGDLWTHKFEDDSTKVLQKFKLPYDQSRKIFAVSQLPGLREAVYVAIPPLEKQLRQDWMDFLHEYVHINAMLHSTNDYSTADMDRLEKHIDVCFNLLVSRIGGAERGVTNYFHYMGSWLPWRVLHSTRGYCGSPGTVGTAVGYCTVLWVLWVLQGESGSWVLHSFLGYCRVLWVLWVLQGTAGTVGYCTVHM
jgi:hypothetical protein